MAKSTSNKSSRNTDKATGPASPPESSTDASDSSAAESSAAESSSKKDAGEKKSSVGAGSKATPPATPARAKKSKPTGKQSSIIPSEHKLENLAAAIAAAGGAENLLTILDHVEQAGGNADVYDSIEAYRALKSAVEQAD